MEHIEAVTLDNGLVVLVEPMSGVRSCGITWLLPAGGAYDEKNREGRAAMWSELLMRGSRSLDSRAQADAFDRVGASRSTDGGNRMFRVGASSMGDRAGETLAMLFDMTLAPRFDDASVEPSRALCLQSLAGVADDPQQRAVYAARARHFPEPINRTGLGTREGLLSLTRDQLADDWSRFARPRGSILAVAGAVDPESIIGTVRRQCEKASGGAGWAGEGPKLALGSHAPRGYAHEVDESNQVQVLVVRDAPAERDPGSVLERVACAVLSGGMSGRLFTEVREKRGLCYSVGASYRPDIDRGSITAYVGTTPERAQESLDVLVAELDRLGTPGSEVTQEEFDRAMVGLKSGIVFSGESTNARAGAIATDQYRIGRPRTLTERTAELDAVTVDAVNDYLKRRPPAATTVQTLGPTPLNPPA